MSLVEAVAASIASTLVVVIIFIVVLRKMQVRWKASNNRESFRREEMGMSREEMKHLGKNIKGVVVEEGGVDVLYMRKLENGRLTDEFTTVVMNPSFEQEDEDGAVVKETAHCSGNIAASPPPIPEPPLKLLPV